MWWYFLGLLASMLVIIFAGICYEIGEVAFRRSPWALILNKPGPVTLIRNGFEQLRRESGSLEINMAWRFAALLELYVERENRRQREIERQREIRKKKKDSNQRGKDV